MKRLRASLIIAQDRASVPASQTATAAALFEREMRSGSAKVHLADGSAFLRPGVATDAAPAVELPPDPAGPSLLRGLRRLGTLLGVAVAGYEFGHKAGQWYFGQETVIARRIGDRVGLGQVSPFSEQGYVIGQHLGFLGFGEKAHIDYANGLLSLKAGRPVDFRTMEPGALADLIEAPWRGTLAERGTIA